MNLNEFQSFVGSANFKGESMEVSFEETHISWIAFSKNYVFKIKKPVKLSFLDFSTLEQRRQYCERELTLNRRFSKIYLDVLPVLRSNSGWFIGKGEGEIVDYAVWMERMESSKRMDKMLHQNKVDKDDINALAKEIASFHEKSEVIQKPFEIKKAQSLFNDIAEITDFVQQQIGKPYREIIARSINWSDGFLRANADHIQNRIDQGYTRDVHGDLHAGNIFLYKDPVLFDCIEFNDEFRQIDLLYEIAFLCMELEAEGQEELSSQFFKDYSTLLPDIVKEEDISLYFYYKCLRANIRAKVKAIAAIKAEGTQSSTNDLNAIKRYLSLMSKYMEAS